MQRLEIIGNIGKDAEIKDFNTSQVINFSVAVTETYTNKENVKVSNTTWYECAYWTNKTAIANYLKKGTQVMVSGKPTARAWVNNQGESVGSLGLNVKDIRLLGSKPDGATTPQPPAETDRNTPATQQIPPSIEDDNDVPF